MEEETTDEVVWTNTPPEPIVFNSISGKSNVELSKDVGDYACSACVIDSVDEWVVEREKAGNQSVNPKPPLLALMACQMTSVPLCWKLCHYQGGLQRWLGQPLNRQLSPKDT